MSYSVRYGKFQADPKKAKWTMLAELREDYTSPTHRCMTTTDGTRFEIPLADMVFVFSKERQRLIDQREAEAKGAAPKP